MLGLAALPDADLAGHEGAGLADAQQLGARLGLQPGGQRRAGQEGVGRLLQQRPQARRHVARPLLLAAEADREDALAVAELLDQPRRAQQLAQRRLGLLGREAGGPRDLGGGQPGALGQAADDALLLLGEGQEVEG